MNNTPATKLIFPQIPIKTLWKAILMPAAYVVIGTLKRRAGVETYDDAASYSPFRVRV